MSIIEICVPYTKIPHLNIPETPSNPILLTYFYLSEQFQKIQFAFGDPVHNFVIFVDNQKKKGTRNKISVDFNDVESTKETPTEKDVNQNEG